MKRLIVMDMDGTLLNEKKQIPQKTLESLIAQEEKGVHLVLASGRGKERLIDFAKQLKMDEYEGYLIESNGSCIFDIAKDTREEIKTMSHEEADVVFKYLRTTYPKHDIVIMGRQHALLNTSSYGVQAGKYTRYTIESIKNRPNKEFKDVYEIDEVMFKLCVFDDPDKVSGMLNDILDKFSDTFWAGRVAPFWIEINPIEISKGNALLRLMNKLDINKEDVYVFGDGENDLSMLEVGHSVAMGNALDSVKEKCEFVTLSNEEDGIAHFIEKYL